MLQTAVSPRDRVRGADRRGRYRRDVADDNRLRGRPGPRRRRARARRDRRPRRLRHRRGAIGDAPVLAPGFGHQGARYRRPPRALRRARRAGRSSRRRAASSTDGPDGPRRSSPTAPIASAPHWQRGRRLRVPRMTARRPRSTVPPPRGRRRRPTRPRRGEGRRRVGGARTALDVAEAAWAGDADGARRNAAAGPRAAHEPPGHRAGPRRARSWPTLGIADRRSALGGLGVRQRAHPRRLARRPRAQARRLEARRARRARPPSARARSARYIREHYPDVQPQRLRDDPEAAPRRGRRRALLLRRRRRVRPHDPRARAARVGDRAQLVPLRHAAPADRRRARRRRRRSCSRSTCRAPARSATPCPRPCSCSCCPRRGTNWSAGSSAAAPSTREEQAAPARDREGRAGRPGRVRRADRELTMSAKRHARS